MSSYQHQSGAQKRKKKREDNLKIQNIPKISTFFSAAKGTVESSQFTTNVEEVSLDTVVGPSVSGKEPDIQSSQSPHIQDTSDEGVSRCSDVATLTESEATTSGPSESMFTGEPVSKSTPDIIDCDTVAEPYITDRANYPITITDPNVKRFIIAHGPCRPSGPFPRDSQNRRCFSARFYERITKTGLKLQVTWLCYSPKLNAVYCEPCWLFGDRKKQGFEPAWARGIRKWRSLTSKIQDHESSRAHIDACVIYEQWRKKGTLDEQSENQVRQEQNFWRKALKRIINVTLTMSMANLAFRGHRERLGSINNGNFLSIIELLADYDPVLKELLQLPQGSVKYLSPKIQNEIIDILSKQVLKEIVTDIKQAQFYSIIMDTTQDIAKIDQLSQIIRYVSIDRDASLRATSVNINEVFLGFHAVKDQSAAGLEKEIIGCIENKGLALDRCRGQGYDGAATMSGIYSGVQSRILKKEKNALYVHCASHNLNLVLQDSVAGIKEVSSFFDVVQNVYTFFGESIQRWELLSSFSSESSLTLKKLCPTRWSSRYDSLLALRFRFVDIMQALSKIILISKKTKERDEAKNIKKKMESFQFVFLIVLQTTILNSVNSVSKMIQAKDMDLSKAAQLIKNAAEALSTYRNHFDSAKQTSASLAEKWRIPTNFESKRISSVKRHFDELCVDERISDPEQHFKVTVFNRCLDIITQQLSSRFSGLNQVLKNFEIIQPVALALASDDDLFNAASALQENYHNDLSTDFPGQLLSFRSALKEDIYICSSVKDLAHLLLVDNSALSSTLPEVCVALLLFLTLPVTVASAERSFSKLKFIKNYLRSTMSEERLSGLAVLSIENERARKLNLDEIVNRFAEVKARRRVF